MPSRRDLLRGLAGAGFGWGIARLPETLAAKKGKGKDKPKAKKGLCARDGSTCRRPGKNCKKTYCLRAPFTIEAVWTQTADHDAFLFVPPQEATTGPFPFIWYPCTAANSTCEEAYPFACINGNVYESGAEVTTVFTLLEGRYEYWLELDRATPAGAVVVVLRDRGGRVVRQWANPANPAANVKGWHVFDIDGRNGSIATIDQAIDGNVSVGAHGPATELCPD